MIVDCLIWLGLYFAISFVIVGLGMLIGWVLRIGLKDDDKE